MINLVINVLDILTIQCNPDNSNSLNTNSCLIRLVAKFPVFLPYIKFEGKTCLIRIGIRTLSVICWHQLIMHVFRPLFLIFSSQLHDFSLHFCYFLCAYAILYAFPDNSNSLLIQFFFHFPSDLNYQGCTVFQKTVTIGQACLKILKIMLRLVYVVRRTNQV